MITRADPSRGPLILLKLERYDIIVAIPALIWPELVHAVAKEAGEILSAQSAGASETKH